MQRNKSRFWVMGLVVGVILIFALGVTGCFAWSLREAAQPYRGQRITAIICHEAPNMAVRQLVPLFEKEAGIKVDVETAPLDDINTKLAMMFASRMGTYDVAYIDKAWMGLDAPHLIDIGEFTKQHPELVDPDFDADDFFPILMLKQAAVGGKLLGYPFDVPLFILVYHKEIFEENGLKVPETYEEFRKTAKFLTDNYAPKMYGCILIAKEHYALLTEYAQFLWAFGGTFFDGKGKCSLNSPEAVEALEFYKSLLPIALPGATAFTWGERIDALAAGKAAMSFVAQEGFPMIDDPARSVVAGKLGIAIPPRGPRPLVQDPAKLSFGEWPGLSRSGGSNYIISKYSNNPEAAFLFTQWATSKEVQLIASVGIGGATPTRRSLYRDPDVLAHMKYTGGPSTTRHFPVSKEIIDTTLGFEPVPPAYPEIIDGLYRALSKAMTGRLTPKQALDEAAREVDKIVAGE